jgi:hypothetical protein
MASAARGVDYLTQAGLQIIEKVVRIVKLEVPAFPNESGSS